MSDSCDSCPVEKVHRVEYLNIKEDISELKDRLVRFETMLARGVLLLVANLVGVVFSLAQQAMG